MDKLKKFFESKKKDVKFKHAGPGQSLTGSSQPSRSSKPQNDYPKHRVEPTRSAQRAGEAALDRLSGNRKNAPVDWSMHAIKAQARREMEQEKKMKEMSEQAAAISMGPAVPQVVEVKQHVMFSCPLLGPQIGLYDDIKQAISDMLHEQVGEDKAVASCLIIRTCNKNADKIGVCVETICRYIQNIEDNPSEEKYRRIRQSNKAYLERVKCITGATLFLEAAGFITEELPFENSTDHFWVFPPEGDVEQLKELRDSLVCSEAVRPQLERSPAILLPTEANVNPELPPEFFALSKEELIREMQKRSDDRERASMLMTKAMRERQNMREIRKYRYSLIRTRFPDGLTIQATFRISEKLSDVISFIRSYLANDWRPFVLSISGGSKFSEEDDSKSLAELYLAPAVVLIFQWDSEITDPSLDDSELWGEKATELLKSQQEECDYE